MSVLEIKDLKVEFPTRRGTLVAVDGVSLQIGEGEVLGVVGESGAGKSLTGAAVIGLLEPPGRIAGGRVSLDGERIDQLPYERMRRLRGKKIAMVFQDPLTSLNPLYTIGRQLVETILTHEDLSPGGARERALRLLAEVGIPSPGQRFDQYPHQFSGGMRQRVVIALALCANPRVVIADEPTTALDVSIQAQIIALLKRLCEEHGAAVMLITHDMGVIAETADRVAVMYAGRIVEVGPVREVIKHAKHPYTRGLMGSIPVIGHDLDRLVQIEGTMPRLTEIPPGCPFHPRCPAAFERCRRATAGADAGRGRGGRLLAARRRLAPVAMARLADPAPRPLVRVEGLTKHFDVSPPLLSRLLGGGGRAILKAVDGVSFGVPRGRTFSLVGESGCGKSTVARLVVGLHQPTRGSIEFDGVDITKLPTRRAMAPLRRRMQMIFQDPYASLNPRWRVVDLIAEPLRVHRLLDGERAVVRRVGELLEQVRLSTRDGDKFPHEFSGGQRQRISIARALASNPEFLVCDEPTSALDVSVQAQILNLMKDLQRELGLSYLFISHDLAVVYHIAHDLGVMYLGRLVEWGPAREVFRNPQHPYTRMLLDAIPDLEMSGRRRIPVAGEVPSPISPPAGCHFHPRCPFANARCRSETPQPIAAGASQVRCHAVEEGRLGIDAVRRELMR